jgi:hypothetical protein
VCCVGKMTCVLLVEIERMKKIREGMCCKLLLFSEMMC